MRVLLSWFRPPVFEDEAKSHEAFLLNVIVWSMVLVPVPYVALTLIRTPPFAGRALLQAGVGEAVNAVLLILLRRGAVRAASILQVFALFAFMTGTAATIAGIESPAYELGYSLVIVIAGVLIGARGAAVVTVASLTSGALMGWRGSLDPLVVAQRGSIWIVSAVTFPVIAVVQYLASRTARNALSRARESEKRFRILADATFEGIIVHEQGVIVDANQRFAELFGFDHAADLVGQDGLARLRGPHSATLAAEPAGAGAGRGLEVIGLRRDGSAFPAETQARAIEYQGKIRHVVAVRDVTEQKRAAAERERLEEQLSRARRLESIGRLAGGVAHDFNNLLTAIMGNVSLLQDELGADPRTQDRLSEVMQASEGAARLTRQLLAVGQKQVMIPARLDANQVITESERVLLRLIGKQVVLQTHLDPQVGSVVMDPGHLEQILVNLCVNARDAMPDGGKLEIRTDLTRVSADDARGLDQVLPGEFVRITVTDTGSGMPSDVLAHVFEPFFTTKGLGRGTGLGLATVHGIVQQNRGFVRIFSELGRGTRFEVCLPEADP